MKTVLLLDEMPERCDNCPVFDTEENEWDFTRCRAMNPMRDVKWKIDWIGENKDIADYYHPRPDWCPLFELPDWWIPLQREE